MKNVSLAVNAVLFILIVVLFFMYNSLKKSINPETQTSSVLAPTVNPGKVKYARIAYINADSINVNYKLMHDFKDEIQVRQNTLQSEYETKARKLQDEYTQYQQKAQSGNISQIDAEKAQKEMEGKKAELDGIQRRQDELMKEVQEKNMEIQQKVRNYINEYNKKTHYDYVLTYTSVGEGILYANDSMDITRDIVSGINKQYADSLSKAKH